jgi:hypothetical protein
LNWEAAEAKQRADQAEENRTAAPFKQPLTRKQREFARRSLGSGSKADTATALCDVADGLAHEYSSQRADTRTHCHCGALADRQAQVDWEFEYVMAREVNAKHVALFLGLGVISWQNNALHSRFSTFHVVCLACADTAFSSKRAFEKVVEPLPECFRRKDTQLYAHERRATGEESTQAAAAPEPAEEETAEYYLAVGGAEKGPFTASQLRQLVEFGRVQRSAQVRREGQAPLVELGVVLDGAGAE